MEIQNKIKHKKRRTRRNLDEMRKRSRIMMKDDLNLKNEGIKKYCDILKRNNQQITADRLTLALFNKAVKSETVTRPIRTDQKLNSKLNCKSILRSIPSYLQLSEKLSNGNKKVCLINEQENVRLQAGQTSIENDTASSSDNTETLSPSNKNTYNIDLSEQEFAMPDSYLSSDSDCDHCIYDEFITNVSTHLINTIPALAKEGVMKKNIGYLHQAYLETCRQETESNILKCIKKNDNSSPCNSGEAIIQNPMDYIQINTCWQQRVQSQHNVSDSDGSGIGPMSQHDSSLNVLRPESPEYIYFPHKLNQ